MTANTTLSRLQELLPQLFQPVEVVGDAYLRFQLTPDLPALLSMERVQEALLVPANTISPLPNLPAHTIGVMNARDRVFCVVDLAQLLGVAAPLPTQREYQVIVVNLSDTGKFLGLAVSRVRGIMRLAVNQWDSIGAEIPDVLTPYLSGCVMDGNDRLLGLNTDALLTSPLWLANPAVGARS
jgi:twitching motility protein PilI